MWNVRGLNLTSVLAIAFASMSAVQLAAADPTFVEINSGGVRGAIAGGVISLRASPMPNRRSAICAGGHRSRQCIGVASATRQSRPRIYADR